MTEQEARALLGLPEPTEKVYDRRTDIRKPPMPEVINRPRGKAMGAVSDFLADLDKRSKSAQNALVDRLMPQGGPNVPFPVGLSLYPRMDSSGNISPAEGFQTVDLPLADIAKTIQASDLMGIGGAGRALNDFSYGDVPKDPYDIADMAMLAPGIAGLIGAGVRGAKGAGRAAKSLAQSDAGYRLANRVAEATGASGLPIIKKGGGNWVDYGLNPVMKNLSVGSMAGLESELENIRNTYNRLVETYGPESRHTQAYADFVKQKEADIAERRFADKNLVKYMRNEMGTENDPIRKAIDEGYSHFDIPIPTPDQTQGIKNQRLGLGFPPQGLATTNAGKNWETLSDLSINPQPAGYRISEYEDGGYFNPEKKGLLEMNPWLAKIPADEQVYELSRLTRPRTLGFDQLLETLNAEVLAGRIDPTKVGTVKMDELVRITHRREVERQLELARQLALSRKDLPVVKEYPEGYRWVELNKPGAFAAESDAMEHSVRGYEPDPDHEDWEKISGNSGNPDYGHGGWEAIKSGKAKVYSLIDENGKPYVTVETLEPTDAMRRQAFKDFYAREGRYQSLEEIEKQNAELPYFATQVKRKFNDVNMDDYPQKKYVTDFMRHKNFNLNLLQDDLPNTGLIKESNAFTPREKEELIALGHEIPEYLTMDELEKLRLVQPAEAAFERRLTEPRPAFNVDPMDNMPGPAAANWRGRPAEGNIDDGEFDLPFKEGGEVNAAGGGLIKALAMVNKALAEARAAGKVIEQVPTDRLSMTHKDVTKRVPELTAAAKLLQEGKITKEEYIEMVKAFKPVQPFAEVPRAATKEEMLKALAENQRDKLYRTRDIEEGYPVGGRLNIPAYSNHGVWIPTLHEQVPGFRAGPVIGYDSHFRVGDATFGVEPKSALNYATGKTSKGTFATIKGNFKRTADDEVMDLAREMMSDPRYRQIGMDPERSSLFYDRETFEPVGEAEDVLQVGPLVFARNPRRPSKKQLEDAPYATGGAAAYKD